MTAWVATPEGVRLRVRLTPKGGRDAIDGLERWPGAGPLLKARVAAPPEDGKANAALRRLLAKDLKVPLSQLSIEAGETARVKTIGIAGEAVALIGMLEAKFGKDRA